jgi:hypothetical protein
MVIKQLVIQRDMSQMFSYSLILFWFLDTPKFSNASVLQLCAKVIQGYVENS